MLKRLLLLTILPVLAIFALASPIKSDEAAKSLAFADDASAIPSASEYIQDGLIAMWDGVENAGWGHSDSSTRMVDLVSDVATIPFPAGRDGNWFLNTSWRNYKLTDLNLSVESITIEVVFKKPVSLEVTMRYNPITVIASSEGQSVMWQNTDGLARMYVAIRDLRYASSLYLDWADLESGIGTAWTYDVGESLKANGYVNGMLVKQSNAVSLSGRKVSDLRLNADSTQVSYAPCYVGCIRLYDRALSPDEIAYNHDLDRLRFNLPE